MNKDTDRPMSQMVHLVAKSIDEIIMEKRFGTEPDGNNLAAVRKGLLEEVRVGDRLLIDLEGLTEVRDLRMSQLLRQEVDSLEGRHRLVVDILKKLGFLDSTSSLLGREINRSYKYKWLTLPHPIRPFTAECFSNSALRSGRGYFMQGFIMKYKKNA